jgi:hypothetical protein
LLRHRRRWHRRGRARLRDLFLPRGFAALLVELRGGDGAAVFRGRR